MTYQIETIRSNMIGCLNLVDVCQLKGVHVTYYGTGCIYHYDKEHPEGAKKGFKETDVPNFRGSFYSKTKEMVEELVKSYDNVLTLRLRLPITGDLLNCRRNLIVKILTYDRVVDIQNSMTVLPEMLPYSLIMAKEKVTGIFNFTNPGCISHNEILELYRKFIDPNFTWKNFSLAEQSTVIKAPRSNAFLDTTKLEAMFPSILPIKESIKKFVFEPAQRQVSPYLKSVSPDHALETRDYKGNSVQETTTAIIPM
eukprot:g1288.t1